MVGGVGVPSTLTVGFSSLSLSPSLPLSLSLPAVRRKRGGEKNSLLPCLLLCISREFLWLEEKAPGRRVDSPMYILPEKEGGGSRECQKRIYGLFVSLPPRASVATQPARQRPFYYSSKYSLNSTKKSVARDTLGIKRQKSHAVMRKIRLFYKK